MKNKQNNPQNGDRFVHILWGVRVGEGLEN